MLDITAACLVITAALADLNHRFVRLPTTIGVMVIALGLSLVIVALDRVGVVHGLREFETRFVRSIGFSDVLMQGMLSLLLFAGALHVDIKALRAHAWQVGILACVGTTLSTAAIGAAWWIVLP